MTPTSPRALSIRQPWAWAIVRGYKNVENRSRPASYRGPVLIHAGLTEEVYDIADVIIGVGRMSGLSLLAIKDSYEKTKGLGAIVGRATLVDCVTRHPSPWFTGPYGYVLEDAQPIEPVPCKGMLGFFPVPDEIHAQIARQESER